MLARIDRHVRGPRRAPAHRGRSVTTSSPSTSSRRSAANIARGPSPREARRIALVTLGGVTQTLEAVREVRAMRLETLWRDVRHASRALRGTPAFTAVALVVLTLAIGVSTAIFSVVDAVVLRPSAVPRCDRLVAVGERQPVGGRRHDARPRRAAELPRLARPAAGLHRARGHRLRQHQPQGREPGHETGDAGGANGDRRLLHRARTPAAPRAGRSPPRRRRERTRRRRGHQLRPLAAALRRCAGCRRPSPARPAARLRRSWA